MEEFAVVREELDAGIELFHVLQAVGTDVAHSRQAAIGKSIEVSRQIGSPITTADDADIYL